MRYEVKDSTDLTGFNRFKAKEREEAEKAEILERIRLDEARIIYLAQMGAFHDNEARFEKMMESMRCETNNFLQCK